MNGDISSEQGPRFQFIDISSTNARKEARAHVMREFMRQKREENIEGPKLVKPRKRQKVPAEKAIGQVKAPKKNRIALKSHGSDESSPNESDGSARPDSTASDASSLQDGSNNRLARRPSMDIVTSRSSSPHSPVDTSRRDPFQALPMRLDEEDLPLVDHCTPVLMTLRVD